MTTRHKLRGRDPLLRTIVTTRKNPQGAITQLKSQRSYRQAKRIIKKLRAFRLGRSISGERVAEAWDAVLTPPPLPASSDWVQEFGWLCHGFQAHAQQLNSFLGQRRQFGGALLLGDYVRAEEVLDEIEEEHGHSFWLAERRLMLGQFNGGFEAHKALLAQMQSQVSDPLTGYVITKLSHRLEPHVNYESFQHSTKSMLRELEAGGHNLVAALIEIQISPWTHAWKSQGQEMLRWCSGRPLVDRYDRAMKILAYMSLGALADDQRAELRLILRDLQMVLDDRQLAHVQWIALGAEGGAEAEISADSTSASYIRALDDFALGRFKASAEAAEALLKKDPTSFDFYEVAQSAPLLAAGMNGLEEGTDSMSVSSSEVLEVGGGSMPPSTSCRGR